MMSKSIIEKELQSLRQRLESIEEALALVCRITKSPVLKLVGIQAYGGHFQHISDYAEREVPFENIVKPDDVERFIHIPVSSTQPHSSIFESSLSEIGVEVATGPVVDFRVRDFWLSDPSAESVPLLYAHHFAKGNSAMKESLDRAKSFLLASAARTALASIAVTQITRAARETAASWGQEWRLRSAQFPPRQSRPNWQSVRHWRRADAFENTDSVAPSAGTAHHSGTTFGRLRHPGAKAAAGRAATA